MTKIHKYAAIFTVIIQLTRRQVKSQIQYSEKYLRTVYAATFLLI